MYSFLRLTLCVLALTSLTGCYNKPVRHLASDISLIQVGNSTREDVIMYLGEPDDIDIVENGVERWLYNDEKRSIPEDLPLVGKYIGDPEVVDVAVLIKNNTVVDTSFRTKDADDLKWQSNFAWQDVEQDFDDVVADKTLEQGSLEQ